METPIEAKQQKRVWWRYWILPSFQFKYVAILFLGVSFCSLLLGWLIYHKMNTVILEGHYYYPVESVKLLHKTIRVSVVETIVYVFLISSLWLVASHAVAGPIYHFEKSMSIIADGDLTHRVHLRKKDELKRTAEQFNSMIESIQRIVQDDRNLCTQLAQDIKTMASQLKSSNQDLAGRLENLGEQISRCTSRFIT